MTAAPPRKILVGCDDPHGRALMKVALQSIGGYQVQGCQSGAAACTLAAIGGAGLILIDVDADDLATCASLHGLKAGAGRAAIPVVMLAARERPERDAFYLASGALLILHKPTSLVQLAVGLGRLWDQGAVTFR